MIKVIVQTLFFSQNTYGALYYVFYRNKFRREERKRREEKGAGEGQRKKKKKKEPLFQKFSNYPLCDVSLLRLFFLGFGVLNIFELWFLSEGNSTLLSLSVTEEVEGVEVFFS